MNKGHREAIPSDSDSNSDIDDEEAPLFFPSSSNFNSATTRETGEKIKGVAFGLDYQKLRKERREKAAGKNALESFDIEISREPYTVIRSSHCTYNVMMGIFVLSCTIAIGLLHRRQQLKAASISHQRTRFHHGSMPSSRWGNRFDDDDDSLDHTKDHFSPAYESGYKGTASIPKYHSHGHSKPNKPRKKKLTPQDMELDMEEWEEYEMEVSNLLASSKPDWDIHQNTRTSDKGIHENQNDVADEDRYDHHWIQYFDQESKEPYYYNIETNITQWDRPQVTNGMLIFDYDTGDLIPED